MVKRGRKVVYASVKYGRVCTRQARPPANTTEIYELQVGSHTGSSGPPESSSCVPGRSVRASREVARKRKAAAPACRAPGPEGFSQTCPSASSKSGGRCTTSWMGYLRVRCGRGRRIVVVSSSSPSEQLGCHRRRLGTCIPPPYTTRVPTLTL